MKHPLFDSCLSPSPLLSLSLSLSLSCSHSPTPFLRSLRRRVWKWWWRRRGCWWWWVREDFFSVVLWFLFLSFVSPTAFSLSHSLYKESDGEDGEETRDGNSRGCLYLSLSFSPQPLLLVCRRRSHDSCKCEVQQGLWELSGTGFDSSDLIQVVNGQDNGYVYLFYLSLSLSIYLFLCLSFSSPGAISLVAPGIMSVNALPDSLSHTHSQRQYHLSFPRLSFPITLL